MMPNLFACFVFVSSPSLVFFFVAGYDAINGEKP